MARITLTLLLALVLVPTALASRPRPDCPIKHCRIHYVSYSYTQRGHDQYGNTYVRTCHVPAHGQRWCGAWRTK